MSDRSSTLHLVRETDRGNESAILLAALSAFSQKGFYGASMRDIARGARTSLSNLYNYYPSKTDLLGELLRRTNDEQLLDVESAVAAAQPHAPARMRAAVHTFVHWVLDHRDAALVALSEVRYLSGAERANVVEARDRTQQIFEQIVSDGVEAREFRTPYPADAARNILSMCSAISTWYRDDGPLNHEQLATQFTRYALALLESPASAVEPGAE